MNVSCTADPNSVGLLFTIAPEPQGVLDVDGGMPNTVVNDAALLAQLTNGDELRREREDVGAKIVWESIRRHPEHPMVVAFVNKQKRGIGGKIAFGEWAIREWEEWDTGNPFRARARPVLVWALRWHMCGRADCPNADNPARFSYGREMEVEDNARNQRRGISDPHTSED